MPGTANQVTVVFKADTQSYTASVKAAKQELGAFDTSVKSAGAAARAEMQEARGTVMVLGEEIGIHLPRHVQKFVAGLPGVASAMSAAFDSVAVIAIGMAIFEAGKKITEFIQKNEEAARKNAEAWRTVGAPLNEANDAIRVANDKLRDAIAKIEGKPQNGLKLAIDEAIESADKLGTKLDADLSKLAGTLKQNSPGLMTQLFTNAASTTDIEQKFQDLQDRIQQTTATGGERVRSVRNDPAALAAAQKDLDDKLAALYQEGSNFASTVLHSANLARAAQAHPFDYPMAYRAGFNGQNMDARIRAASGMLSFFGAEQDSLSLNTDNAQLTKRKDVLDSIPKAAKVDNRFLTGPGNAGIESYLDLFRETRKGPKAFPASSSFANYGDEEATKEQKAADEVRQRAAREGFQAAMQEIEANEKLREAWVKVQVETGKMDKLSAAIAVQQVHGQGYSQYQSAFVTAQGAGAGLTRSEAEKYGLQYSMQSQQDQFAVSSNTVMGDFTNHLRDLAEEFTNLGSVLSSVTIGALESFNHALMKELSTPASRLKGQHLWRGVGASVAESAGSAGLNYGEGELMKVLFGSNSKAKLGTKDNPMYVRSADSSGSGSSGGGLLGGLFSKIFGGGTTSSSDSSGGGIGSGISAGLGFLGGLIPGFAEGGMIPSNMPVMVGENGPEILAGAGGHSVIPNNAFGGGDTYHIDARGANDPAATQAAVNRALRQNAGAVPVMAKSSIQDHNRRVPSARRI